MAAAIPNVDPSPVESEVLRIRGLMERSDFVPALRAAQLLRDRVPENRDALYMIAVCQRYLQRIAEALKALVELEIHHPSFSRLFQERGHCYVAMRKAEPAIEAFVRAVNLNPSLPASWNCLQVLFRMTGRAADAEFAGAQIARLAAVPKEVLTAYGLFADGETELAEQMVRTYLLTHGDQVDAMRLLALIGMKLDVSDDAELLLESALKQSVIIATPSTLMALLKAVAYGWRQSLAAENAAVIRALGEELYRRLGNFAGHLGRLGQRLGAAVEAYNGAVGSLERQVLPQARRFPELGVTADLPLEALDPIEQLIRRAGSVTSVEAARGAGAEPPASDAREA